MNKFTPDTDGIDHINVYSKGKTSLGRFLTNMHHGKVTTPHGEFPSVESYWHWLKLDMGSGRLDKSTFMKTPYECKKIAKEYADRDQSISNYITNNVQSDYFKDHIRQVIHSKIINSELKSEFINSTLPFSHYYYYGSANPKIHYLDKYQWVMDIIESIRVELKSNECNKCIE